VTSLFFSGSFFISRNIFSGATSDWNLRMNMLDLEASHHFNPSKSLTLTPKVGIKGGTIRQSINISWNAFFPPNPTEKLNNNFFGIGPSFGLDAKWAVTKHFGVVGSVGTALMYGRWNVSDMFTAPGLFRFFPPTTISTSMTQAKLGTLMMDYFFGLEWLYEGRSRINIQLGYEMQYWPSQLRLVAVQQLPTSGDLTIQGATCGITIDL
jgi:hypothetical protein